MYAQPMPPQEDPILARLRMAGRQGMLNRPPMPEQAQGNAYGRLGTPLPRPVPAAIPQTLPVPGSQALPAGAPVALPVPGYVAQPAGPVALPPIPAGQPGTMSSMNFRKRPPAVRQG